MKKVLILAHDFPPLYSAGAQRPFSWMKYLPEYNIYPVVVTRHWDGDYRKPEDWLRPSSEQNTVVETDEFHTLIRVPFNPNLRDKMVLKFGPRRFRSVRRILSFLIAYLRFFFPIFDSTRQIFRVAEAYLKKNPVDVIIATGEPFILFKYAYDLNQLSGIPYILDYRDGWTTSRALELHQKNQKRLINFLFKSLEQRYISKAKQIISPSPDYLKKLQKFGNRNLSVIYNGFFSRNETEETKNQIFTITYSGIVYPFQPLNQFLEIIIELISEFPEIKINLNFIGTEIPETCYGNIKKIKLADNITISYFPRQGWNNYLKLLCNSELLLLLTAEHAEWLNAKLFDYISVKRKILLFTGDSGIMEEIIRETSSGIVCHSKLELKDAVLDTYRAFQKYGVVNSEPVNYQHYDRRFQAGELAKIINLCAE